MFPEQFIQLSGYFIHFLQYILYIRFDARHGSHILYLELSFMGYRFFSASTMLLNSTSQLVLGHVQSVHPPQHVIVLLQSCAFHLRISVQTAQHTSHLIHSCLSSPDIRPGHTTHIASHSLMPFISGYLSTPHNTHHTSSTPDPRNRPPLKSYHHFEHFHTLFCQNPGKLFYIE